MGEDSMIRKIALGVSALALTVGGLAVGAGPAFAGKPSLSGVLDCASSGTTTFNPSLVLTIPNKKEATATKPAKPGKDKGSKLLTNTTYTGCTGSGNVAGTTLPTGGTSTTKVKAASRLCTNQGSVPPGKTKTEMTGGSKAKFKPSGGTTTTFLDSGTALDHSDDIPLPTDTAGLLAALAGPHGTDQLYILGAGSTIAGKAYSGEHISSVSHSPGILAKFNACVSTAGLGSISTTGTIHIG
jgi:hypothetical protein